MNWQDKSMENMYLEGVYSIIEYYSDNVDEHVWVQSNFCLLQLKPNLTFLAVEFLCIFIRRNLLKFSKIAILS